MRLAYICIGVLLLLTACQQEIPLQAEHFPLYEECTLLHEYGLYADLDCKQYAIQATQNEELILDELCEFPGYGCTDFETQIGYTDISVTVYLNTLPEKATVTYTALTRPCDVREDHIRCRVPFVARDRHVKQPFFFTLTTNKQEQEALLLAYI